MHVYVLKEALNYCSGRKKTSLSLHQTLGCWPNKQKEKNSIKYCRKREASDQRHGALCCFLILLYSVSGAINSVGINCVMTPHSLVSFSPNWTALLLCSQPLSLDFSLFFLFLFLLSVQTATHSPAQSEWGSYADHFFRL